MQCVYVNLGKETYPILIGNEILKDLGKTLLTLKLNPKVLIITNQRIAKLYLSFLCQKLEEEGFEAYVLNIPEGERYKNYVQLRRIYTALIKRKFERDSAIIALGGGTIGDLAGFAAATFMRGIAYIQIPTSLLAQVDSAIGGKTGIDFQGIKNVIGSFYQPKLVYADISLLSTLPQTEIFNALAEVIKYGVIKDESFFSYLEENIEKILKLDPSCLEEIVSRCARIKAEVVERDEKDRQGIRAILNYGHSLGHCFEAISNFRIRHGEAVGLGMLYISKVAQRMGLLEESALRRQEKLLQRAHLPTSLDKRYNHPERIISILEMDKKRQGGRMRFVLPIRIGEVVIKEDVPEELIREVLG
ncbi:MAG: 3-dehydroquinate synthase [Candidatus Omnitrophota bacterium]|nr:MAG: 3-dehydroquinate synthase [Candidatus Omnitrophota bacterium]